MSDNIILDDGRVWWSPTIVVANVLFEIGNDLEVRNKILSKWLIDVSGRPAPFMHFDIRGLSKHDQDDFYAAVQSAYDRLYLKHGESWLKSNLGDSFKKLIKMHQKIISGEPPERFTDSEVVLCYVGEPIDLNGLWDN